jgi:hypothetical protein
LAVPIHRDEASVAIDLSPVAELPSRSRARPPVLGKRFVLPLIRALHCCLRLLAAVLLIAALLTVGVLAPGCAAVKATQQPGKKDLAVLSNGMARTHVIAELGAPVWSDERDGDIVDVFAFKQGYSKGVKAGRALIHGAADVATFGLWEVVGIPAESLADGTDVRVEVHYDRRQVVRSVEVIKGDKVFEQPKLAAWWQRQRAAKARHDSPDEQSDEAVAVSDSAVGTVTDMAEVADEDGRRR